MNFCVFKMLELLGFFTRQLIKFQPFLNAFFSSFSKSQTNLDFQNFQTAEPIRRLFFLLLCFQRAWQSQILSILKLLVLFGIFLFTFWLPPKK